MAFRSPKNTNLVSKKGKIGWHRSTEYFFRNTEKRYPHVTTAAAQQQLSSSSAAAAEAAAAAVVAVEAKGA